MTTKLRTFLYPSDFSEPVQEADNLACSLARHQVRRRAQCPVLLVKARVAAPWQPARLTV